MKALKFKDICTRQDEEVFSCANTIVNDLNEALSAYDVHSKDTIIINGRKTNRYVEKFVSRPTDDALAAVYNVFSSAGYAVIICNRADADATIYVIFDPDIAPGADDEEEEEGTPSDDEGGVDEEPEAGTGLPVAEGEDGEAGAQEEAGENGEEEPQTQTPFGFQPGETVMYGNGSSAI